MEYLKFILYGLIQGFTEFIPVSSTAHLKVISLFFGIDDPGPTISAIIQLGSVLALLWYFRSDFLKLRSQTFKNLFIYLSNDRLLRSIFIGTVPIILLGGIIKLFLPYFFVSILRSNLSIALLSFFTAIFMYIAETTKKGSINLRNHKYIDSFLIGLSQAFAIFPGVSRSGITISTGLLFGWERGDAAKFSFLLGIPAITFAAIVEFLTSFDESYSLFCPPLFVGLITAFLSSLIAIDFLLKYFSANGLKLFIIYRIVFSVVILLNLK